MCVEDRSQVNARRFAPGKETDHNCMHLASLSHEHEQTRGLCTERSMTKMLPLFSEQGMGEVNGAAVRHDERIIFSILHPGAVRLFPRCNPPQSGRLKMSRAGSTPLGEIPGTARCVIRAVVV
jgi:hypothetical protein